MKQRFLITLCMMTIVIHTCSAAVGPDDIRIQLESRIGQCLVPVTLTLKWQTKGKTQSYTHKGIGVVISSQGAVILQGVCDTSLAVNRVDDPKKDTITGQPEVKFADGRTVAYRLKAYHEGNDFSILVPAETIGKVPYIDITQPQILPLGQPVLAVTQTNGRAELVIAPKKVMGVQGKPTVSDMFEPNHLVFSTLTGQFRGWFSDETLADIALLPLDKSTWEFISMHAGIQIKPVTISNEPVDTNYQHVYDVNKNSVGILRFLAEENIYANTVYYVLSPSGDIVAVLPPKVIERASRANAAPAKATLPDGTRCQMRWKKLDKVNRIAILSPVIPLKKPLTPILWRTSSLPQITDTVYGCKPSQIMSDVIHGYDPSHPDRIALDSIDPEILFDSEGRAAAMIKKYDGLTSFTTVYDGADTVVKNLRSLVPGIRLRVESEAHSEPSHPVIAKIPHDIRNWGYLDPNTKPFGTIICSAVCIDDTGYYVMPLVDMIDDGQTIHPIPDSTPDQIRSAYTTTDNDAAIVDSKGQIGTISVVFYSEKLGLSIGKLRKPPVSPIKAIVLSACQPPAPGEKLYSVDASLASGNLMQLFISHTVLQSAEYPYIGYIDPNQDQGALCYSLDGQPRGYITTATAFKSSSHLALVDLAEIAKMLAYVKNALGNLP